MNIYSIFALGAKPPLSGHCPFCRGNELHKYLKIEQTFNDHLHVHETTYTIHEID